VAQARPPAGAPTRHRCPSTPRAGSCPPAGRSPARGKVQEVLSPPVTARYAGGGMRGTRSAPAIWGPASRMGCPAAAWRTKRWVARCRGFCSQLPPSWLGARAIDTSAAARDQGSNTRTRQGTVGCLAAATSSRPTSICVRHGWGHGCKAGASNQTGATAVGRRARSGCVVGLGRAGQGGRTPVAHGVRAASRRAKRRASGQRPGPLPSGRVPGWWARGDGSSPGASCRATASNTRPPCAHKVSSSRRAAAAWGPRTACGGWSSAALRRALPGSWHHGASEQKRARVVVAALSRTQRVMCARRLLSRPIRPVKACCTWRNGHRCSQRARKMSAGVVTRGAGATLGSGRSRLPLHPKEWLGPQRITWASEMAKHNSGELSPLPGPGVSHRDRRARRRLPSSRQRAPGDHRRQVRAGGRGSRPHPPGSRHQWRVRRVLGMPRKTGISTQPPGYMLRDDADAATTAPHCWRKMLIAGHHRTGDRTTRV